ncbi:hypothetical protein BsWGS_08736 [Bradybaena similaris]
MSAPADVKELQGTRHGLKRLKSMETSHGSLKKPKTRLKASVAMRSLLNLLHITDKRKESPVEASAVSTIEDSVINHTPSKLSSLQTLNPTNNWLLYEKEYKDNLSKTWAYFVSDSDKEASECEDITKSQKKHYSLGTSEGHFEHGYCEDSPDDPNENLTLVERPLPCRIKMGISVLQGTNTAKLYSPEVTSLDLHRSESPQGRDASLPAICTDHRCGLPAFMDANDSADVSNEGNRKTTCSFSDSSCVPKASFSATEPGIYDELPGKTTHISLLPLKPIDSSEVAKSGPQPGSESCSSKSFITVSSSYHPRPNPRTVTSDDYFQDARDASKLTGQVHESILKVQPFSVPSSSLLPLKVTQYSKSSGSESQLANESIDSINLIKHSTCNIKLQNPKIAATAPNTNIESLKNGSSLVSQQFLMSQDFDELLDDRVIPGSVIRSSPIYSNKHALLPSVENNRSSIEKITTAVSSNHTAATGNMSSQQRRSFLSCNYPLAAQTLSQPVLQSHQSDIPTVSSAIARTAAMITASHVPATVSAASQLGSHEEPNVSFPKSARRCLHGNVKHQFADASLESNFLPKRAKTVEYGLHKLPMISASSAKSKTTEGEFKKSSDLDYNFVTVSKRSGESYSMMNALLTQRTSRNYYTRPSNVCFRTSDSCEASQSGLPEIDMNGNYVVLLRDRSVQSPQTKQYLNPGNVIPAPLSTSSPMHPKRKPSANHEVLQSLQDFVSPVRHNPKHETRRPTPKELNPRETRRQRHGNNRCNRLNIYGLLDTSSDQELGFIRPRSINYILLIKAAELIVNRIPFKKEIKPFINMKGLLKYLQSFYLSEMSKLPNRNVQTISEYRTLKSESCQFFRPEHLTYETCLSELLMSVLVKEPVVVQTCSDFIFEHLRFLAGCPNFYNMPPELFVMLLSNNKSIVLGYHGFPLPYEESLRQVQRAGRKYIQAHKFGNVEIDSKLEKMLSFVIGQTAVLNSNEDHENVEIKFKHSYHEIKYRHSEQFVTDTISEHHFLPSLCLTAAGSQQADSEGQSSEYMSYEKYCSNAYILRRIYFSYVIQDKIPIITHIRLQYAVQGRKVTYSIGSSTSKSECVPFQRSPDQDSAGPYAACTTQASDSSHKAADLPKSDSMATAAADKSPTVAEATEPAGRSKMSAVQLARGEHVTGVLVQGESVLHNLLVITNIGRYIRAHGVVEFPGNTDWKLLPPPEESKYCLQAIIADSRTVSSQTYLHSVRVIWSVLSCPVNDLTKCRT